MRINTKNVSITMPPSMHAALKKLALEKRRSVSGYIRWVLRRHIDAQGMNISLDIQPKL